MKINIQNHPYNKLQHIPFHQVEIKDKFWTERQRINREVSIFHQYQKLEDKHVNDFRVVAGLKEGVKRGEFYYDSDLYKWLEAACYILQLNKDNKLEEKVNEIVNLIKKAQMKDGYVNTFYFPYFIHKRFTNLQLMEELYCAGHLFQAAIAHYNATGQKTLLDIAKKFADLLVKIFLGGKRKGAPGHAEIELALIELYRITKRSDYLLLAEDFINRRGNISNFKTYALNQYFDMILMVHTLKKIKKREGLEEKGEINEWLVNLTVRDWIKLIKAHLNGEFLQLNIPVRDAYDPVGHAVRAMYLYCGIADLYSEKGDESLLNALKRIWLKMVKAKMYVTGGIGSIKAYEGFGKDFSLKNEKSYSETCAAIGNIMWNWKMLQITANCKYADLTEKLLYNAMLVGQSIDGKNYTYSNPLRSEGNDERKEWFICPCCPPNVVRIIASLGQYIYSLSDSGIWIHQYIGSKVHIILSEENKLTLIQESEFPWNGLVKIKVELKTNQNFSMFLRIPKWTNETKLLINQERYHGDLTPGKYIEIIRNWSNNDVVELNFKMYPKLKRADPRVKANRDKIAISNGPLIYCLEQIDNQEFDIFNLQISKNLVLRIQYKPEMLGGINVIEGVLSSNQTFTAIPYYVWGNRGPNKMQVWHNIE
ncbi:MAG: glycoside hydrolase family 127 protein [Promethearchaeota archaeon]